MANPEQHGKEDFSQFLTFILADEEFGLDILKVMEIRGWEMPTPIPSAPKYVKGVINIRGLIVPVYDLRERFGLAKKDYDQNTVVIVLQVQHQQEEQTVGVIVDAVSEVYDIKLNDIKNAPEMLSEEGANFIHGLGTVDNKMIVLLNITNVIYSDQSHEELGSFVAKVRSMET